MVAQASEELAAKASEEDRELNSSSGDDEDTPGTSMTESAIQTSATRAVLFKSDDDTACDGTGFVVRVLDSSVDEIPETFKERVAVLGRAAFAEKFVDSPGKVDVIMPKSLDRLFGEQIGTRRHYFAMPANANSEDYSSVIGYNSFYEHFDDENNWINLGSVMFDTALPRETQKSVYMTLFDIVEKEGEKFAYQKAEEFDRLAAESKDGAQNDKRKKVLLARSAYFTPDNDFVLPLLEARGYDFDGRLEMAIDLSEVDVKNDVQSTIDVSGNSREPEIDIRSLDLESDNVESVHSIVSVAFGEVSLNVWKKFYWDRPTFSPELCSIAWIGDKAVSAVVLERLVDGEKAGEDILGDIRTAECGKCFLDEEEYHALSKDEIKARSTQAYVCGVSTFPEYRGRRLAEILLRRSIKLAAAAGLKVVSLGTDRLNESAVKVYKRAGMKVVKEGKRRLFGVRQFPATSIP